MHAGATDDYSRMHARIQMDGCNCERRFDAHAMTWAMPMHLYTFRFPFVRNLVTIKELLLSNNSSIDVKKIDCLFVVCDSFTCGDAVRQYFVCTKCACICFNGTAHRQTNNIYIHEWNMCATFSYIECHHMSERGTGDEESVHKMKGTETVQRSRSNAMEFIESNWWESSIS